MGINIKTIEKLEKILREKMNPFEELGEVITVDSILGETIESQIIKKEKLLGRKINRNRIFLVEIVELSDEHVMGIVNFS